MSKKNTTFAPEFELRVGDRCAMLMSGIAAVNDYVLVIAARC